MSKNGDKSETFLISVNEFNRLQEQMVSLKNQAFEAKRNAKSHERRVSQELNQYKNINSKLEKELSRLKQVIKRSKNKTVVHQMENEIQQLKQSLKNNVSLYTEQNNALKKNVQLLLKSNNKTKNNLKTMTTAKEELELRLVEEIKISQKHSSENPPEENTIEGEPTKKLNEKDSKFELLYNSIEQLKKKNEEMEKKKNIEFDNLTQQNKVLQDKNQALNGEFDKMRKGIENHQKNEHKLQYRIKIIKENHEKDQKRFQMQIQEQKDEFLNREAEIKTRNVIELKKLENNLKKVIKEEEKKYKILLKKKNQHQKKKNEARGHLMELNKEILKLRKEKGVYFEKNKVLEKKLKNLQVIKDIKDNLVTETKNLKEMVNNYKRNNKKLSDSMKSKKKILREKERNIKYLNKKLGKFYSRQIKIDEMIIKYNVEKCLSNLIIKDENKNKLKYKRKFEEVNANYISLSEKFEEIMQKNTELNMLVLDKEKENVVAQRSNKMLIKELRMHLKNLKKKKVETEVNNVTSQEKDGEKNENSEVNQETNLKNRLIIHSRSSSSLSNTSLTDIMENEQSKELLSEKISKYIEQLQKDNETLVSKIANTQTRNWKLEDNIRILENNLLKVQEEVSKKTDIISNYIKREKIGRLSPMQEKHKLKLGEKRNTFMGKLFGKNLQQINNPDTDQLHAQMQIVVEETLLKNIQLQNNIKTMGEEVQRLMNINDNLKTEIVKLSKKK